MELQTKLDGLHSIYPVSKGDISGGIAHDCVYAHALTKAIGQLREEFSKAGVTGSVGNAVLSEIERRSHSMMEDMGYGP